MEPRLGAVLVDLNGAELLRNALLHAVGASDPDFMKSCTGAIVVFADGCPTRAGSVQQLGVVDALVHVSLNAGADAEREPQPGR